jgi:serine/threonine protein kinase
MYPDIVPPSEEQETAAPAPAGVSCCGLSRGDGGGPLGTARLGRYQLLRKIAVGGMAEIYLARVSGAGGFEKNVVVKRILPQLAESDEFFTMFLDEARIAATLQHPNVVHIYDAGQADNEYFIAMEHLDGADLHTVRRVLADRGEAIPLQHAIFIVSSVAAGLHYAHEKLGLDGKPLHIVHRDVTPQNVFLTREGWVKLVDFGIAKAANRVSNTTTYGTLKGKLAYMSPEQCRADLVDRRSDIYSLGVLLYEMTCGRRPYAGKSEYELLREIVEGAVPPPSLATPGYPPELEVIAMRALAREPADRYPDALAMEQDLARFARRNDLHGSTLTLAAYLEPLLDAAQEQARARRIRRLSSAPPRAGAASEGDDGDFDQDWQPTVAAVLRPRSARGTLRAVRAAPPDAQPAAPLPTLPHAMLDMRVRPRRTVPLIVGVLLLVGSVAGGAVYYGRAPQRPGVADLSGGPVVDVRPVGAVHVLSDPPGAAVWLSLGPAPAEGEVDGAVEHLVRVEHEGYRTRHVTVGASDPVVVELEPAQRVEVLAEPTGLPGATQSGPPRKARIQVSSRPPAATVWLLVGVTPARVALPGGARHELRVARDGYLPAFFTIEPERSGPEEPRVSASLVPRADPR